MKLSYFSCCLSIAALAALAAPCDSPMIVLKGDAHPSPLVAPPPVETRAAPVMSMPVVTPSALPAVETHEVPTPVEPSTPSTPTEVPRNPIRQIAVTDPPRKWILSDAAWKQMSNSHLQFDFDFDHEQYIGVRFIIPFGS